LGKPSRGSCGSVFGGVEFKIQPALTIDAAVPLIEKYLAG
jgi:hypothetical protein